MIDFISGHKTRCGIAKGFGWKRLSHGLDVRRSFYVGFLELKQKDEEK